MMLSDKVALVSGSNKGIGLSVVSKFVSNGCFVYAGIRNNSEPSAELTELKKRFELKLIILQLDVTNADECKIVIQRIQKEQGRLDILVNNAGVVSYELVPFINFSFLDKMLQTNVVGLIRLSQLASRLMSRKKRGSIINISSIVGLKGAAGQAAYAASKGAVNAFTMSLAKELSSNQIRVNAVAPGMVATKRLVETAFEKFSERINDIGLGRMADPDEIANICLFLASDNSSYVTGQIIEADGYLKI